MSPYGPEARQAVGALRGDRLPLVTHLPELIDSFRRDTSNNGPATSARWESPRLARRR